MEVVEIVAGDLGGRDVDGGDVELGAGEVVGGQQLELDAAGDAQLLLQALLFLLLGQQAADARGHVVERFGQEMHLLARLDADAVGEVAAADLFGALGQLVDGAGDDAHHAEADEKGDDDEKAEQAEHEAHQRRDGKDRALAVAFLQHLQLFLQFVQLLALAHAAPPGRRRG